MVGATHFYSGAFGNVEGSKAVTFFIIAIIIGAAMELNALGLIGGKDPKNKLLWPYESHKNAIITAFGLWAVLWILTEILFKK